MAEMEPLSEWPPHAVNRPAMRQSWRDVTFLHWRCDPARVRPLVPAGLELDLYDGAAWIGLVPFYIEGLTLPRGPSIPWLSNFPETNVRTYVADRKGRRGVLFFSLDAARLPAVIGARSAYALPYFWARMRVERDADTVRYTSVRRWGRKRASDIEIRIGERVASPSELEVFVTARFRLYAARFGKILKADVQHQPWPLQRAAIVRLKQDLVEAARLPPLESPVLAHYAARVDVLASWPELA
jgi:uncharacterized protein YqjF (DUF2071 family)